MVLPAFEAIELLRDYRRAERAIAKRWGRRCAYTGGGAYGNRLIAPTINSSSACARNWWPEDAESGLVVPFYVKAETYGTEGASSTRKQ